MISILLLSCSAEKVIDASHMAGHLPIPTPSICSHEHLGLSLQKEAHQLTLQLQTPKRLLRINVKLISMTSSSILHKSAGPQTGSGLLSNVSIAALLPPCSGASQHSSDPDSRLSPPESLVIPRYVSLCQQMTPSLYLTFISNNFTKYKK